MLLIIVEFLLKIIYVTFNSVLFIVKITLDTVFDVNMLKSTNKQKRTRDLPDKSMINRHNIDANWETLLSRKLMMENESDKPNDKIKEQYAGSFSHARKKRGPNLAATLNNNSTKSSHIENCIQKNSNLENKNRVETNRNSVPPKAAHKKNELTKFIAMDCEMVGIGYNGEDHMLARVSLVNKFGDCIYDKFVKPREEVKDYRTKVSGVRREDLLNGEDFATVQREVSEILKGKILVGHSMRHDLAVLYLSHPKKNIRDTSKYKPFRSVTKGSTPSLKRLASELLNVDIQSGEHSSVEDARAAMQLYCMVSKSWEQMMREKRGGTRVNLTE